MAMPVDVRQLALVTDSEAPVVPRQVVKSAKVIEVPVVEVREWGSLEQAEARSLLGVFVAREGLEATAHRFGLEPAALRRLAFRNVFFPVDLGERVLATPLPPTPDASTREQMRSRRKRAARARTISVKRMTKREIERGRALYPEQPGVDYERPKTRGDCERLRGRDASGKLNACCFVSCKWNLYLDVNHEKHSIKINFPDIEPHEMVESCALDVADRGGVTLEEVGVIVNVTRERARQLLMRSFEQVVAADESIAEYVEDGPVVPKRRLPVVQDEDIDAIGLSGEEVADGEW